MQIKKCGRRHVTSRHVTETGNLERVNRRWSGGHSGHYPIWSKQGLKRVSMRPIFHRHCPPLPSPSYPLSLFLSLQTQSPLAFSLHLSISPPSFHQTTPLSLSLSKSTSSEMAQRTEKEETEFKVPEALTLCINNCGLTGNPATNNMCQKCFNATSSSSSSAGLTAGTAVLKFSAEKIRRSGSSRSPDRSGLTTGTSRRETSASPPLTESNARREVNRCSGCRRKVGLTGFRCRCGELFCSEHRYSDRHDCS